MTLDQAQPGIPAGPEPKCSKFWCGLLEFVELEKPTTQQRRVGEWYTHGCAKVHLGIEQGPRPAQKAHPACIVSNLAGIADWLAFAGHPIQWDTETSGRKSFFSDDPIGNRIDIFGEP